MPITRGARKKLRQDKKRTTVNLKVKQSVKAEIAKFRKKPSEKLLASVFSALDRALKKNIFKAGKVARFKSRLAKKISASASKKRS